MKNIVVYTGPSCNFCGAAKRLLERNGLSFDEIDISSGENIREEMIEKLKFIRLLDDNDRINKLFYEIDLLGNYTSASWLLDLSISSYLSLVRYIYEFWNSIPSITKRKICPYFNPFQEGLQNINFGVRENMENVDYVKRACVTVMENLIYTGINNEYKQIGTMHILRALTMVSNEARANLPWLYESIDI